MYIYTYILKFGKTLKNLDNEIFHLFNWTFGETIWVYLIGEKEISGIKGAFRIAQMSVTEWKNGSAGSGCGLGHFFPMQRQWLLFWVGNGAQVVSVAQKVLQERQNHSAGVLGQLALHKTGCQLLLCLKSTSFVRVHVNYGALKTFTDPSLSRKAQKDIRAMENLPNPPNSSCLSHRGCSLCSFKVVICFN
jgi:hypothetical protein